MSVRRLIIFLAGSFLAASAQAAPTMSGATVNGAPGYTVNMPINFDPTTSSVVGVKFWLTLPSGLSAGAPVTGSILTGGTVNKVVLQNTAGTVGVSTYMVVGLFDPSPASGACSGSVHCGNTNAIPVGKLMDVPIAIAPGTAVNTYPIQISNISYVDASGNAVAGAAPTNGSIVVGQFSPCDVKQDGNIAATDIQQEINWITARNCPLPIGDVDMNGSCGSTDLQRIINAKLNGGICVSP